MRNGESQSRVLSRLMHSYVYGKSNELTALQKQAWAAILEMPGRTVREIEKATGIGKSTVASVKKMMIKQGVIDK